MCKLKIQKPAVVLTSDGLCDWLPDEKGEEAKRVKHPVRVVSAAGYLIQLGLWKRQSNTLRLSAMQKGRGAAAERSEVVPPFPVVLETNALSKRAANGKHRQLCSDKKSHDCPHTTPYDASERGGQKYGV